MNLPEIDEQRIDAIIAKARDLHARRLMDRATWFRLVHEFCETSRGSLEMPGALMDSGKTEWFEALRSERSERVA